MSRAPQRKKGQLAEHALKKAQAARLLRQEFRKVLKTRVDARRLVTTDAIIVLSGRVVERWGKITSKEPENRSRVRYGVQLQRRITIARRSKNPSRRSPTPRLVLIGTSEQLAELRELAMESGASRHVTTLSCGIIGKANTKTQFEVIWTHPFFDGMRHVTIVTSRYHVPRVVRTADRQLPTMPRFTVVGAPARVDPRRLKKLIESEIPRILEYAERGDLSLAPLRDGGLPHVDKSSA